MDVTGRTSMKDAIFTDHNEQQPLHCHDVISEQPIKLQNLKLLIVSVFFFALACGKITIKHRALRADVTGQGNILSAGAIMHLSLVSAWKFSRLGQLRG